MKDRKFLVVTACVVILAAVGSHWLVLQQVPKLAMSAVTDRIVSSPGGGYNILRPAPPVTPAARRVVRPSPDLIYSICVYDVSVGPVVMQMAPGPGYHSLSLYDADTNNFYAVNDREAGENPFQIVLSNKPNDKLVDGTDIQVVTPTETGVALIRRQATPEAMLEASLDARKGDTCRPVKD